jgi:hypothetical protein
MESELDSEAENQVQREVTPAAVEPNKVETDQETSQRLRTDADALLSTRKSAQGGFVQADIVMPIPALVHIPGIAPWVPGTSGFYPRPTEYASAFCRNRYGP